MASRRRPSGGPPAEASRMASPRGASRGAAAGGDRGGGERSTREREKSGEPDRGNVISPRRPERQGTLTLRFKRVFNKEHPGNIDEHYEMDTRVLGSGSFGTVKKAKCKTTGHVRAVKAIDISKIPDPQRFENEVAIQQEMDHPHIVKLYEVFKDAKRMYLVLELCTGGELFDRIVEESDKHEGQAFNELAAATYMQQILRAMHYLHKNEYVHRDIKPENFLLQSKAPNAPIKIIDFGLAKKFVPGSAPMRTKAGTPYYVAPQVLMGGYDEKCDIWSCGVIAYILLCGYPPFYGDKDEDILRRVRRGSFDFPSPDWDQISGDAKDFIRQMMTFDPAKRPPAQDVLEHTWMQGLAAPTANLPRELGNKLRQFRNASKLKKVALTVIATQLKDDDIKQLKDTFIQLDENQDGMLSYSEVIGGMRKHKIQMPADLEEIMRTLDTDGSGTIDYTEFIAGTLSTRQYLREDVVWSAFRTFDLDGDGNITKAELAQIIGQGGLESELLDCMISEVDLDGDGVITYDEFVKMMGDASIAKKAGEVAAKNAEAPAA